MSPIANSTPAILDLDQALDNFRDKVAPVLDPAQEESWNGVKLKEKELVILAAGIQLVGHCIAILIYRLCSAESVKMAAEARALGKAGLNYTREGFKDVTITVIGNVVVQVRTAYKLARGRKRRPGRKRKRGKRGKSRGQGFYPVLKLLGIADGVSPLVRCRLSQAATQLSSFEQAKQMVKWLIPGFSTRRIRRISESFCKLGLAARDERLARLEAGDLPAGEALKGKRVVISVDGGRMKIRRTHCRGRKRKSGWPGYETNPVVKSHRTNRWREPKLLTIYVLDEGGHKTTGVDIPLVNDGTLEGLNKFLKILRLYLHELGIAQAETVVLAGDGAPWIWNNIPSLLLELGCRSEQIVQVLDNSHAVEHIYELAEALFGSTDKAKSWAQVWAKKLKKGQSRALVAEIQGYLADETAHDLKSVQREYEYFLGHHRRGRLDYARFRARALPSGSGAVESLIRQAVSPVGPYHRAVNGRLKSAGKNWLQENGKAFLHARCQWAAHQWTDFCDNVLTFGLAPPT